MMRNLDHGDREAKVEEDKLISSYYVDVGDPDVLALRREDGSLVAAFSAQGATHAEIWSTARQDAVERFVRTSPREAPGRVGQRRRLDA